MKRFSRVGSLLLCNLLGHPADPDAIGTNARGIDPAARYCYRCGDWIVPPAADREHPASASALGRDWQALAESCQQQVIKVLGKLAAAEAECQRLRNQELYEQTPEAHKWRLSMIATDEAEYLELAGRPGMESLRRECLCTCHVVIVQYCALPATCLPGCSSWLPLPPAERLGALVRMSESIEISRDADSWNCWLKAGEYGRGTTPEAALTRALLASTEVTP